MIKLKFCRGCSEDLPLSSFGKRSDRPSGLKSRCRECMNADLRERYQDPEFATKDRARSLKWAKDNPEKKKARGNRWASRNRKKLSENAKLWYEDNKSRVRDTQRGYERGKYNSDLQYKLRKRLRSRIYDALLRRDKKAVKAGSAVADLGCSISELISTLEAKFALGMAWETHGTLWEVDHIMPLADFDLTDRKQFLVACHYTNLQPLWIPEHLEKTKQEVAGRCGS